MGKLGKEGREKVARHIAKRFGIGVTKGSAIEGATEGAQDLSQQMAIQYINEQPLEEIFQGENLEQLINSTIKGSIGGGTFTGTIEAITGESPTAQKKRKLAEDDAKIQGDIKTVKEAGGLDEEAQKQLTFQPEPEPVKRDTPQERLDQREAEEANQNLYDYQKTGIVGEQKDNKIQDVQPTVYKEPVIAVVDRRQQDAGNAKPLQNFTSEREATDWIKSQKQPKRYTLLNQLNDEVIEPVLGYEGKPTKLRKKQRENVGAYKDADVGQEGMLANARNIEAPVKDANNIAEAAKYTLLGIPFKQQFSGRGGASRTDKSTETEVVETPLLRESDQFVAAQKSLNDRLDAIAQKGTAGFRASEAIRKEINDNDVSVGQASIAFKASEIISEILPKSFDTQLRFVQSLKGGQAGLRQRGIDGAADLITLSYQATEKGQVNNANRFIETATHEAFHVLQDFYSQNDKGASGILAKTFGKATEKVNYANSPVRQWMKRLSPQADQEIMNSNDYKQADGTVMMPGSELQAHAFEVYDAARRDGKAPVMAGGLARYFRFLSQFIERMGNSVRGMGFRSAQDVYNSASTGAAARSFDQGNQSINYLSPEQTHGEETATQYSGRTAPHWFTDKTKTKQSVAPDNERMTVKWPEPIESKTLARVTLEKGEKKISVQMLYGHDYYDANLEKRAGHGMNHAKNHIGDVRKNTPHERFIPFLQDVLTNGKARKVSTARYAVEYKGPDYKKQGQVIIEQSPRDENVFNIITAMALNDGGKDIATNKASAEDVRAYQMSRLSDSISAAKKRISTPREALNPQFQYSVRGPVIDSLTPEQRKLTILDRITSDGSFIDDAPLNAKGKRTLQLKEDAIDSLQEDRGGIVFENQDDETRSNLAKLFAAEAEAAYQSDPSAIGWYENILGMAKDVLSLTYPEIRTDPNAEHAFDYALAVSSNGMAVIPNFDFAATQYEYWRDNGIFIEKGTGAQGKSMVKAFELYNVMKLDENMSDTEITDFMNQRMTVSEIKQLPLIKRLIANKKISSIGSKESADSLMYVSYIIGPKIGSGFYQNVRGNFEPLTMDRWFMRFFNRLTGRPFVPPKSEKLLNANRDRLLKALRQNSLTSYERNIIEKAMDEFNIDIISDNTVDDLGPAIDKVFQRDFSNKNTPKPNKTELFLATGTITKNLNTKEIQEDPRDGKDRSFMRDVAREAKQILSTQAGIEINTADLQALMWYAEKRLWSSMNVRKGQGDANDYLDGAIALAKTKGIKDGRINEALPDSERGRVADPELGQGRDETASERDESVPSEEGQFSGRGPLLGFQQAPQLPTTETRLYDFIKNNPDGFTVDPDTITSPDKGFAVAPVKAAEMVVDYGDLKISTVRQLAKTLRQLSNISSQKLYAGGWLNTENNKFYIDATMVADTLQDALYIADASSQIAIFDLGEFNEINTKEGLQKLRESGTYSRKAHDERRANIRKLNERFQATGDRSQGGLEQAFDTQYSGRGSVISDDIMADAVFMRSKPTGGFQKSTDNARIKPKLFKNREVPDGTMVMIRPNLNGFIVSEGGPPTLTQTVHTANTKGSGGLTASPYGTPLGYDKIGSVRSPENGVAELNVVQSEREKIATKKASKSPMAGTYGAINQISEESMLDIMDNPTHVLGFNPFKTHLFADNDGFAVKSFTGEAVHYGGKVYVKGDVQYWNESEAPKAISPSVVQYKPDAVQQDPQMSSRQSIPLSEVFLDPSDQSINGWLNKIRNPRSLFKGFTTEFVDSLSPFKELEIKKTGKVMNFSDGVYKFMAMAMNRAGRTEMVLKNGAPELDKDGTLRLVDGREGLLEIIKKVGNQAEYFKFRAYAAARRAKVLGDKEKFITQDQINTGMALETDLFKQIFDEYQVYNRGLLKFLVQSGMISDQERKNLEQYDYIPFYRAIEDELYDGDGVVFKQAKGPNTTEVFNNPKKTIKEYSGGQGKIGDLVENSIRNAQAYLDSGLKNVAMQKASELMVQTGEGRYLKSQKEATSGKVVRFKENGKDVFFEITGDPQLYLALTSMTPRQTKGIFKAMESLARVFREGITHAPPFMIANLIRGDMAGVVTVDAPITPGLDSARGFRNALKNTELVQELKLIAGVGGYAMGEDSRNSSEKFLRDLRLRNKEYNLVATPRAAADVVSKMWNGLTKLGEASELATREAIMRKLMADGMSKGDAAYEALNLINFNRRGANTTALGSAVSSLVPLVPFLNARIQGLYRTFEPLTTGKEANRANTIKKGLMLMGANMALYSLMSQDDRWEDEAEHRKLAYHIIYPDQIGLGDVLGNKTILIPRAFEVGAIFTTLPELILDSIRQKDGDIVSSGVAHTFLNTFSFNPIPQAARPLIEIAANYDFFTGRQLDSAAQLRYSPSARTGPTTPAVSQKMSELSQETLSPNQIGQVIEGYLGTLGSYTLSAMDVVLAETGAIPERPTGVFGDSLAGKVTEALGFGRFVKPEVDPSNRHINDFYELKSEVDRIYATVNRYKKSGEVEKAVELIEDNRAKLSQRKRLLSINENLRKINEQIRLVRSSDQSANQKQTRLKVLIGQRNRVAKTVSGVINQIKRAA